MADKYSKDVEILFANLALAQAWLANYDELAHTNYHKHELKHVLKRACELLEKHTGRLNILLHDNDSDSEILNAYTSAMEYLVNLMATCPPSELMAMVYQLQTYQKQIKESNNT